MGHERAISDVRVRSVKPLTATVRILNERVAECDMMLAVIGKGWLDGHDAVDAAAGIASIGQLQAYRVFAISNFCSSPALIETSGAMRRMQ